MSSTTSLGDAFHRNALRKDKHCHSRSGSPTPTSRADVETPPFVPTAPMNVPRARHATTALLDASGNVTGVLVTGGIGGTTAVNGDDDVGASVKSAEVYGSP